ncbi:MAG: hypothetical protein Q4B52_01680, partial [Tissierellia bacterium]|nr:hypothetical protein [Tissierellia bacterium]
KKDSSLYYDGYIKLASEIIKENHPRITNDMDNRIYDKFREDLYTMYDFNKDVALSVTNNDIDEANKRAKKKLEEVKYGDIGLVLQELKKMYLDWNK